MFCSVFDLIVGLLDFLVQRLQLLNQFLPFADIVMGDLLDQVEQLIMVICHLLSNRFFVFILPFKPFELFLRISLALHYLQLFSHCF